MNSPTDLQFPIPERTFLYQRNMMKSTLMNKSAQKSCRAQASTVRVVACLPQQKSTVTVTDIVVKKEAPKETRLMSTAIPRESG